LTVICIEAGIRQFRNTAAEIRSFSFRSMVSSQHPSSKRCPLPSRLKGMTLVEVMVAASLFVIVMLGAMAGVLAAYRLTLSTRYQDRALNAMVSIIDQFQNSPSFDHSHPPGALKTMFEVTTVPTGTGLAWDQSKQCFIYPGGTLPTGAIEGDAAGLVIPLNTVGSSDLPIEATITREVTDRTPSSARDAAGKLVEGKFVLTYQIFGHPKSLQFRVLRNLNPSDK
jgi:prepilin-type N-terminal cleavage/methylation domain-containing protein